MQPKYSQAAFDAFATQQGLDEEYRQKLAALMGVQQPAAPIASDAGAMVGGMDPNAINPYAPQPMDMYAQTPPQDAQPNGFSDVASDTPAIGFWPQQATAPDPRPFSEIVKEDQAKNAPPPEAQPAPEPAGPPLPPIREATGIGTDNSGTVGIKGGYLDLRGGGGGGGVSAGSLKQLEALGGMAAGTQQSVDEAFKNYGEAEANQMAPIAAANQNVSDVYGDVGAVKGYEAQVIQQRQKQFESKFKEVNEVTKKEQDKLMGMDPLDPQRAWKQANVGGKLAIALSYVGAAIAMNFGNDPHAAQRTTEAIFGKDLEKQKLEYEKQRENVDVSKNQYAALMAQYKDETAAQAAYFEPIYESLANKISQHVASGKAGQASAQMDTIGKQFALKASEMKDLRTQSALQQAKIAAVRGASAGGSSAGEAAVLLDDKEQTKLQNELVRTSEGSFLLSSSGDEQIKEARKITSVANNFITDANAALSLANSVGSAAEGLGPGWLNQARFVKLKGALTALGIQYGKTNEMGAYDAGLQQAVERILGNPNSSITDVRNLIAQAIERSRSKTRVYISQNKNFRHANIVPYKKKGYLGVTQEGIVPGAYVTSQDPNLPTPVEKP
mgnify:CR=1 FL=1